MKFNGWGEGEENWPGVMVTAVSFSFPSLVLLPLVSTLSFLFSLTLMFLHHFEASSTTDDKNKKRRKRRKGIGKREEGRRTRRRGSGGKGARWRKEAFGDIAQRCRCPFRCRCSRVPYGNAYLRSPHRWVCTRNLEQNRVFREENIGNHLDIPQ